MMLRTQHGPRFGNPAWITSPGLSLLAGLILASSAVGVSADPTSSPYRGLWAGQVNLNFVNEVPVPLDKNNNPVAPDPRVATPTFDQAQLRLLLHVDGSGQVRLLRDVAVLVRTASSLGNGPLDLKFSPAALRYQGSLLKQESDYSLVTDERLYGEFPPQPALRLASAVHDFGDERASHAVLEVIQTVAEKAVELVLAGSTDAVNGAKQEGMNKVVNRSDVAVRFAAFLADDLKKVRVDAMALGDVGERDTALTKAQELLTWSPFFPDSRGVNMVNAIIGAAADLPVGDEAGRKKVAQNTAAAHADLAEEYPRFLAGRQFGDMIAGGAAAAGPAALVPGATRGSIGLAVRGQAAVRAAQGTATSLDALSAYSDTRSTDAFNLVVEAIIDAAASYLGQEGVVELEVVKASQEAGLAALANDVPRYPVPAVGPTPDYNSFIKTAEYINSPALAAEAAVKAVQEARQEDPFLTPAELTGIASDAATDKLREGNPNAFTRAAGAARRELPLAGAFGPGSGDPRFTFEIKKDNLSPLQAAGLTGEMFLPASHPTNPFRHRKHPDHRYGYDLTRKIRLDFDAGPPAPLQRGGYGVSRISGVYREEILGLHKPLGPNKDLGLRVEGRFELNRISLIDALNAR